MKNMQNTKAKSFITIMIVIAVVALLLRIAIDKIIKINIVQNESRASVALKFISAALENYAKDNNGSYPIEFSALTKLTPPYLDNDYVGLSPLGGYNYSCPRLEPSGYTCYASPVKCRLTGIMIYTVSTGGLFISEECKLKD